MTSSKPTFSSLPGDLSAAEQDMQASLLAALSTGDGQRWGATLKFENLRIMPVALRLAKALVEAGHDAIALWPDAGAAALARRDAPDLVDRIHDFRQWMKSQTDEPSEQVLLTVMPQPADYDDVLAVCEGHAGPVLMLNGRLEDAAVGIGSVARERRRGFVASWQQAYWLEPMEAGALQRCFPDDWRIFRADPDGYRQIAMLTNRPDPETLSAVLAGEDPDGLKQQLGNVDRFLDGLRK